MWDGTISVKGPGEPGCIPVPKKQSRGTCDTNTYQRISLTSPVSKVLCMILNARLSNVAEENGLLQKNKVGFAKQKGCKD